MAKVVWKKKCSELNNLGTATQTNQLTVATVNSLISVALEVGQTKTEWEVYNNNKGGGR